jgi:hypothetical protein
LSEEEKSWAKKICEGFGQRVCGYDMLRCDNGQRSQVIDVNGWSFVKGNETYYGNYLPRLLWLSKRHPTGLNRMAFSFPIFCVSQARSDHTFLDRAAEILAALCMRLSSSPGRPLTTAEPPTQEAPTWLLKANVTVFRHADRTPKQKLKLYVDLKTRRPFLMNSSPVTFQLENHGLSLLSLF